MCGHDAVLSIFCTSPGKGPSTQVEVLCEDSLAPTQDIRELMGLCSGQFNGGGGGGEKSNPAPPATPNVSGLVTTQSNTEEELLGLCSARFPRWVPKLFSLGF